MLDKEREHKSKLPGVKLPDTMKFTIDLKEAVEGKDISFKIQIENKANRKTSRNGKESCQ